MADHPGKSRFGLSIIVPRVSNWVSIQRFLVAFSESAPPVLINDVRKKRVSGMNPATWTCATIFGRTIKLKQSAPGAFYFDLTTAESFATKHADAFVIDRHPLSKMIG